MAASEGGKEVVYIRAILQDFGFTHKGPTNLYEDNLAVVDMSINSVCRKYSSTFADITSVNLPLLVSSCLSLLVRATWSLTL
jgi:hypothetical protein